jgi:hypothetical protein
LAISSITEAISTTWPAMRCRFSGGVDQFGPRRDLARGLGNQLLDLLGRTGGALRQFANFLGNNGKSLAGIAGTRGLDTGVERQQVGLEGDLVDDRNDLVDLAGRLFDIRHGFKRRPTTSSLCSASCLAAWTTWRVFSAPSDDFCTVAVIWSSVAAVCSSEAACCSVRRERSSDAETISLLPESMLLATAAILPKASAMRDSAMLKSARNASSSPSKVSGRSGNPDRLRRGG